MTGRRQNTLFQSICRTIPINSYQLPVASHHGGFFYKELRMKKSLLVLLCCFLSSCSLESRINWAKYSINVERDTFKKTLLVCTDEYKTDDYINGRSPATYAFCYYEDKNNKHIYSITGKYVLHQPLPVEFNEAIDKKGNQLKIKSTDDRRLGATINNFAVQIEDKYIENVTESIDVRIYGKYSYTLHIPYIDILALKEKIKEENL